MSSYSSYPQRLQLLPMRSSSLDTLIRATKPPRRFLYCALSLIALLVASNSMHASTVCNSLIMLLVASNSGFARSLESNSASTAALSSVTSFLSSPDVISFFAHRYWRRRQSDSKNAKMTKPITAPIPIATKALPFRRQLDEGPGYQWYSLAKT